MLPRLVKAITVAAVILNVAYGCRQNVRLGWLLTTTPDYHAITSAFLYLEGLCELLSNITKLKITADVVSEL